MHAFDDLADPLLTPEARQGTSRPRRVEFLVFAAAALVTATGALLVTGELRWREPCDDEHSFQAVTGSEVAASSPEIANGSFVIPPQCLHEMAGVALSGTALLAATVVVVPALGFELSGVEAESAAAAWQATMGDVEKASLFAYLQSVAARGELLRVLEVGLPVVGNLAVSSAAFCAKLEEILDATAGAAEAFTNLTKAALGQIKRAADDSKAIEKLHRAAEGAARASKDAVANATSSIAHEASEVKDWWDNAAAEAKRLWDHLVNTTMA